MEDLEAIRQATVSATASAAQIQVNQRALIDKILARYASANAVYRELLQNSNDANAKVAELRFTTEKDEKRKKVVKQVIYRNNGMPFRPQDWERLKKIAEGNPDVSKVGAFGVGAYTMFSISEEPMVLSGSHSLCFIWRGDALWYQTAKLAKGYREWTSFVLPSRDPYGLPDLDTLGQFLCASLTFTQSLHEVRVFVNEKKVLTLQKTVAQPARPVNIPQRSTLKSIFKFGTVSATSDSKVEAVVNTSTPKGLFTLQQQNRWIKGSTSEKTAASSMISESIHRLTVTSDAEGGHQSSINVRFVSGEAATNLSRDLKRRMQRVTMKNPPEKVTVHLFLNAQPDSAMTGTDRSCRLVSSFRPAQGRIFIGFRTSQTTGLSAHVAAPFVPTVEREAMDLQDPALREFNTELLHLSGMLLRLLLEHTMYGVIDTRWQENEQKRLDWDKAHEAETKQAYAAGEAAEETQLQEPVSSEKVSKDENVGTSSKLIGFARFMARGVQKKLVSVVNSVEDIITDGGAGVLLNPPDLRPLSAEEHDAVVIMQAFCPIPSTPDPVVGTALAQGFMWCMPQRSPPVLTRTGVVRGDEARLPNHGIEGFLHERMVRTVIFRNCEEYHEVIAGCQKIELRDLVKFVGVLPLEKDKMVTMLKWFVKFDRFDPAGVSSFGPQLKEAIRFYDDSVGRSVMSEQARPIRELGSILFYVDDESALFHPSLPMPETVMSRSLENDIGSRVLSDRALRGWFSPLPIEIWAEFVAHHTSMTAARPEDETLRVKILEILSKEYARRSLSERRVFASFCQHTFSKNRCIPFESDVPSSFAAAYPSDVYVYSADLRAFEGVGSFHKASRSLKVNGISEEFLLQLGVRKSVSVDFLFSNLENLQWSSDPRPLVEYLRTATLTTDDVRQLSSTQYLPAQNDKSKLFAPSELYLPNPQLVHFPFVQMLHWPSEKDVSERSDNGVFLVGLGMKSLPPLIKVLDHMCRKDISLETRTACLDFLCERMGPRGSYHNEYKRLLNREARSLRFIPCVLTKPFSEGKQHELRGPTECFSDAACGPMGFAVLDPRLGAGRNSYANLLQVAGEPSDAELISQLLILVKSAKTVLARKPEQGKAVLQTFEALFGYLSRQRVGPSHLSRLKKESFIPCHVDGGIKWHRPDQVYFRSAKANENDLTEELFQVIDFNQFLASTGVKEEATTRDLFAVVLESPTRVLDMLGTEAKYRALLRRIAANPPFQRVTAQIQNCPFLIAYKMETGSDEKTDGSDVSQPTSSYRLAKAKDIFVVDNAFYGRMFGVEHAPHASDLEAFYVKLGSAYLSESVDRRFEIVGKQAKHTTSARRLRERLLERAPLLVSPNVTSRTLRANAESLLSEQHLCFSEATKLMAVYTLRGQIRRNSTTCAVSQRNQKYEITVLPNFDWFDVGSAVGDIVLSRCQLEDAFFFSSLLEAPLDQLRARGFPVDRIVQLEENKRREVAEKARAARLKDEERKRQLADEKAKQQAEIAKRQAELARKQSEQEALRVKAAQLTPSGANTPEMSDIDGTNTESVNEPTAKPAAKPTVSTKGDKEPPHQGIEEILLQMFPDADQDFIKAALGTNPSMDDVKSLAERMAAGDYKKSSSPEPAASKKGNLRKRIGRALTGRKTEKTKSPMEPTQPSKQPDLPGRSPRVPLPGFDALAASVANANGGNGGGAVAGNKAVDENALSTPASDASSHAGLEKMLERTVRQSNDVSQLGVESQPAKLPVGLDRGDTCEVIPGQHLQPFSKTTNNGLKVFSSSSPAHARASNEFLVNHFDSVVERFSVVLADLSAVYGVRLNSVAIYHNPAGGTIAFNSRNALHFNVRFFHALHTANPHDKNEHRKQQRDCYSYWYVVMAHELAHHLVSAHNKEHGFYTESFVHQYMPKLLELLARF